MKLGSRGAGLKDAASFWPRHTEHNTHDVSHAGLRSPGILYFMTLLKSTVQMFFFLIICSCSDLRRGERSRPTSVFFCCCSCCTKRWGHCFPFQSSSFDSMSDAEKLQMLVLRNNIKTAVKSFLQPTFWGCLEFYHFPNVFFFFFRGFQNLVATL